MTSAQIAVLGIGLFASPVLIIAGWMFVACRYLEYIESFFRNSAVVVGNKNIFAGAGVLGKVMRAGSISAMLSMSRLCIRKGFLHPGDVQSLPVRIKRLLLSIWALHLIVSASLAAFCLWIGFLRG